MTLPISPYPIHNYSPIDEYHLQAKIELQYVVLSKRTHFTWTIGSCFKLPRGKENERKNDGFFPIGGRLVLCEKRYYSLRFTSLWRQNMIWTWVWYLYRPANQIRRCIVKGKSKTVFNVGFLTIRKR